MIADRLLDAARALRGELDGLRFSPPVTHVYDPLDYAWAPYEAYVRRFGARTRRVVLLGMNPGPWGMMQTGVPFGEVSMVRDWMGIEAPVARPARVHPKRPIEGFACRRAEVSGRRLWGWAAARFGSAPRFFEEFFVLNWCPLVWLEASGRNRTPEQLPARELAPVAAACDAYLRAAIGLLAPEWAIGVGGFAEKRLRTALGGAAEGAGRTDGAGRSASGAGGGAGRVRIGSILHPSPASPAANRGWAEQADRQLAALGVLPA